MPAIVKPRHLAYAAVGIVLIGASGTLIFDSDTETPTGRAYAECLPCGLSGAEIDELIDDCRHSTLNSEDLNKLFDTTFTNGEDRCMAWLPCVEALLGAAARILRRFG